MQGQDVTPVFMGTAYQQQGRAAAAGRRGPLPARRRWSGKVMAKEYEDNPTRRSRSTPDPKKPFVGMAFKIVEDPFGQLTFMRIYQGTIAKGETYYNQRTGQKERFSRIVRMHADKREEVDSAAAGDIVAIMGVDCASGDTFAGEPNYCTLESMFIARAGHQDGDQPASAATAADKLGKALQRFRKEDPTFQRHHRRRDGRDGDRRHGRAAPGDLRRAHPPRVRRRGRSRRPEGQLPRGPHASRPSTTSSHKKQTGGSGQFAHIVGRLELLPEEAEEHLRVRGQGHRRPHSAEYIPSVEKGFRDSLAQGSAGRLPDRRRQGDPGRRLVPRSRQLGHGLPDCGPQLLPRDVPEDEAGPAGAGHEGRDRSAQRSSKARSPAS